MYTKTQKGFILVTFVFNFLSKKRVGLFSTFRRINLYNTEININNQKRYIWEPSKNVWENSKRCHQIDNLLNYFQYPNYISCTVNEILDYDEYTKARRRRRHFWGMLKVWGAKSPRKFWELSKYPPPCLSTFFWEGGGIKFRNVIPWFR